MIIKRANIESVIIYPNPTQSEINIIGLDSNDKGLQVKVYNKVGQLLSDKSETTGGSLKLSLEDYIPGLYLLEVTFDSGVSYHKVVKE